MTTKAGIFKAVRQKCMDCTCHQLSEIRDCRITTCSLWPFRFGSDPEPSQTRGFAKSDVYREELPDEAAAGSQIATLALPRQTLRHHVRF